MKKTLSILLSLLCFCSATFLVGCDDGSLSESASSSTDSGSTNTGDDSIAPSDSASTGDGGDTADEKVIEYVETEEFKLEEERIVSITNVAATTATYDLNKINEAFIDPEKYEYLATGAAYTTTDINEIYAVYDEIYKNSQYVSGKSFLIGFDLTGLENVEVTYELYLDDFTTTVIAEGNVGNSVFDREGATYRPRLEISITGEIEVADGVVYEFEGSYNTYSYMNMPDVQQLVYDSAEDILENGLIICRAGYSGMYSENHLAYHLNYGDELADGVRLGIFWIDFHGWTYQDEYLNTILHKTAGQFYDMLKDKVFIYDYDYYKTQFDEEE